MTENSEVTALADGANNCWSVISSLKPHCKQLEPILDWFHIAMKFQTVRNALGESFEDALASCKWEIWHGKANVGFSKLEMLMLNLSEPQKQSKLKGLYDYLKRNRAYIVDYSQRKDSNQTFTSQVAKSHIESIINARHKKTGKMQWSREGAHNVLQIRAEMIGQDWLKHWQAVVLSALDAVA